MKNIFKLGAILAVALLAGCASDREVERVAPLSAFQPSLQINKAWLTSAGHGTSGHYLRQNPHVAHGKVYAASYTGEVTAVDASRGLKSWQVSVCEPITSGVGAGEGVVVVGTLGGNVYALSEESGKQLWVTKTPSGILAAPVVAGNKVIIKTDSGDVQALDIRSGQRLWNFHYIVPELTLRGASSPVVVGNQVIAGLSDGQLVSLNLNTGRLNWSQQIAVPHGASIIERLVDIDGDPVVSDGVIYVVSYQGKLAAVDLRSGHVRWQQEFSSHVGLTVDSTKVYVADDNSHVWALNRNNGRVVWHQEQLEGRGLTKPVLHAGGVVVGDASGYLHWLACNDGHFMARQQIDSGRLLAAPVRYESDLIVLSSKGTLAALIATCK